LVPDSGVSMQTSESEITGPLQAKIMMILKDEELCGVDIMKRLNIKSPGTIYPVLEELRDRQLIDYRLESTGATRKKIYFLTSTGMEQLREHLVNLARKFCCDPSLYIKGILENMRVMVDIKQHQKILCTLEYDEVKRFLRGTDVTFSYDLSVPSDTYDLALSFLGVGCLIGKETAGVTDYVNRIYRSLRKGGSLLAIEIEKTDNMFARIFFEDIAGLKQLPGLQIEELEDILRRTGFKATEIRSRSGLLYALSRKM
jgi:DNA-binding PadR family transcriptional regulator